MKPYWLRESCILGICILSIQITLSSQQNSINNPPCHRGIMSLFHWCEQSDCANKCNCRSKNVCKQICGQDECNLLNCSSTLTCHQSVLLNDYLIGVPHVKRMISYSPITQQECTQGKCELMKAERAGNKFTRTFQSCSEGNCGHLYSKADHTKQFCGNCKKMTCDGEHAKNCTQLCVLGKCENMYCNAKHCEQLCAHESTCNLTCGPNAETCHQTCSYGSTCTMNCQGKHCAQTCTEEKNCVRNLLRTTERASTTEASTTTQTPSRTNATTVPPSKTSTIHSTTRRRLSTILPTLMKHINDQTRVPSIVVLDDKKLTSLASSSLSTFGISFSTNCLLSVFVSIVYVLQL